MIIRTANEADYDSVYRLMYQIFEIHLLRRPDIYREGDPYSREQFMEALADTNRKILLAQEEQKVVGLCYLVKRVVPEYPILKPGCIAYIEDLGVDREHHRKGIGRMLYEEAVRVANEWDADTLELKVWEVNAEAREFYEAVGLRPKNTRMEVKLKGV